MSTLLVHDQQSNPCSWSTVCPLLPLPAAVQAEQGGQADVHSSALSMHM